MRQYRGLTKDGKRVYGWHIKNVHKQSFIVCTDISSPPIHTTAVKSLTGSHDIVILGAYEVIPETVGQYLRKDKNGNDIYSNMPIRYSDKEYPKGFIWDEDGLRWTLNDGYFHTHYGRTGTGGEDDYLDLEIIGNIHQNPKIMEKKHE